MALRPPRSAHQHGGSVRRPEGCVCVDPSTSKPMAVTRGTVTTSWIGTSSQALHCPAAAGLGPGEGFSFPHNAASISFSRASLILGPGEDPEVIRAPSPSTTVWQEGCRATSATRAPWEVTSSETVFSSMERSRHARWSWW